MVNFLIHPRIIVSITTYVLFLALTTSCSENKNAENKIKRIGISDEMIDDKSDYSDIIEVLEVVKLQTSENSIIGEIRKIEYINDKFYIKDKNQVLFIFDSNGNFIHKLNKRGRGPKEYLEMRDYYVNDKGFITVLSYKALITYNSNLEFIDKRKFNITSKSGRDLNPLNFFQTKNHTFLHMGSFGLKHVEPRKESTIYCINKNNEIIKEFIPITSGLTGHQSYYRSGDATYNSHSYGNDTVYSVLENEIKPVWFIDFQNKKITENEMMGDRAILFNKIWKNDYKGMILRPFENETYLSFSFASGQSRKQAVLNKNNGVLQIINVGKTTPIPKIFPEGICNNSFFSLVHPFMLTTFNENGIYNDLLKKHNISDIDISDNPIIFKFNFTF